MTTKKPEDMKNGEYWYKNILNSGTESSVTRSEQV
jgi:hypothetical protein